MDNGIVVSTNPNYYFTLLGNRTFVANFEKDATPKYDVLVSINPTGAGSVTGTGNYDSGAVVNLVATANSGYTFRN
jgi:hypothetical protein